ncbi:hypothetical protein [Parafilimonas sp.]|uniref:hypothetical protein n=1 Tax=Parafilimonas sp. TaxID=1969739 RepID=UPI003F7EE4B3
MIPGKKFKISLQKMLSRGNKIITQQSEINFAQADKMKNILVLIPIFGTILFVVLYVVATFLYPGGSQADKNAVGFSWTNNYWCNLLNENAINGQLNPAKPVALTAMLLLCFTLAYFWFLFPNKINLSNKLKLVIQISGTLSMAIALLLFTNINHDLITNLASSFGAIATIGTFTGLYKNKWFGLFAFGLLNILLAGLNNLCYYNKALIVYLPVIQKITFATFLIWVCSITINLYCRQRTATT